MFPVVACFGPSAGRYQPVAAPGPACPAVQRCFLWLGHRQHRRGGQLCIGFRLFGPVLAEFLRPIGDVVNTAARLQGAARPGEVVVMEETYRSVAAQFPDAPQRRLELKGEAEPVALLDLLRHWRRRGYSRCSGRDHGGHRQLVYPDLRDGSHLRAQTPARREGYRHGRTVPEHRWSWRTRWTGLQSLGRREQGPSPPGTPVPIRG